MKDLVIVGSGGHGRELLDTVMAVNASAPTWNVLGFVDDDPQHVDRVAALGLAVLGNTAWLAANPCSYALGIGSSATREGLAEHLEGAGCEPTTIVHPRSHVGLEVRLDPGVVVYDRCTITTNVRVGRHTHLNVGCAVQHDSVVGEFVQFSPGVLVNGDCTVGDRAFFGTGAIVTRGHEVGADARVGAGAVVLSDVIAGTTVLGVPARRS